MIEHRGYLWLIAACITAGAVLVCVVLSAALPGSRVYPNTPAELKQVHEDQCEKPRSNATVDEPENTWSNTAYFLAGVLVLLRTRSLMGVLFGAHLCVLALFSGLYHATLEHLPQVLDVVAIYGVLFCAILLALDVLGRLNDVELPWWAWTIAVVALDILSVLLKTPLSTDSTIVFAILVSILLVIVLVDLGYLAWNEKVETLFGDDHGATWVTVELLCVAVIVALGLLFRLTDGYKEGGVPKLLCNPEGPIQAHAMWHVIGAAALLAVYDLLAQFQRGKYGLRADRPAVLP